MIEKWNRQHHKQSKGKVTTTTTTTRNFPLSMKFLSVSENLALKNFFCGPWNETCSPIRRISSGGKKVTFWFSLECRGRSRRLYEPWFLFFAFGWEKKQPETFFTHFMRTRGREKRLLFSSSPTCHEQNRERTYRLRRDIKTSLYSLFPFKQLFYGFRLLKNGNVRKKDGFSRDASSIFKDNEKRIWIVGEFRLL